MTSPIEQAFQETVEVAVQYQAVEPRVKLAWATLMGKSREERATEQLDGLRDALVTVAVAHDGPHQDCRTCHALRAGLEVAVGVVRSQIDAPRIYGPMGGG